MLNQKRLPVPNLILGVFLFLCLPAYGSQNFIVSFLNFCLKKTVPVQLQIWDFRRNEEPERALALQNKIAQTLETGEVAHIEKLEGGGTNQVFLVRFTDGTKGIWKPLIKDFRYNDKAELAAYAIDKLLGLDVVPITVKRTLNGKSGTMQLYVEGAKTALEKSGFPKKIPSRPGKIKFLDYLLFNKDRNEGNYLYVKDTPIAIDHGMAFKWGNYEVEKEARDMRAKVMDYYPGDAVFERLKRLTEEELKEVLEPHFPNEGWEKSILSRVREFVTLVESARVSAPVK